MFRFLKHIFSGAPKRDASSKRADAPRPRDQITPIKTSRLGVRSDCGACRSGSIYGFNYRYALEMKDSDYATIIEALAKQKDLRFGALHKCMECGASWYFDPARNWMETTPWDRLALIDAWNEHAIFLAGDNLKILDAIGKTPHDIYGNGKQYVETPCGVVTTQGEQIDTAIVSFQNHAPFERDRQYRLASDIAEIFESPFALPLKVREETANAEEKRMGFAPTIVEVGGKPFILNWRVNFFMEPGLDARDAKVSTANLDMAKLPPIAPEAEDITYFVADPAG